MFRARLLALLLGLGGLPGWLPALRAGDDLFAGYLSTSGLWGVARFKDTPALERDQVLAWVERGLADVEERLGRRRGRPFLAVLAPTAGEFERIFRELAGVPPEEWLAGVAFPGRDLLLVRCDVFSLQKPPRQHPRSVLAHELAHLVLHRRAGAAIPRWLDEGLAMQASGEILDPADESFLSGLARLGALHSLAALEERIPPTHQLAAVAYQESWLIAEWLRSRWGLRGIGAILDSLEAGETLPAAIRAGTGLELAEFEAGFIRWLSGRRPLWEIILHSVNFWTVLSLLALAAIARSVLKKRRGMRRMAAQEKGEGNPQEYLLVENIDSGKVASVSPPSAASGRGAENERTVPRSELMSLLATEPDGRVLLRNVSWTQFQSILDELGPHRSRRITYDRGWLEIMAPSSFEHERPISALRRLLDCFTLEMGIELLSVRALTIQKESVARAVEADESFYIKHALRMHQRSDYDPESDPPPDLAIEMEVSRRVIPRLPVYSALGVPEIWRYDGKTLRILQLQSNGEYLETPASGALPTLPVADLKRFLDLRETLTPNKLVIAFRDWIRENLLKP